MRDSVQKVVEESQLFFEKTINKMRKRGVPSCSFLRAFQWNSSAIFAHTFAGFDEHRHAKNRLHIVKKRQKRAAFGKSV